MTSIVALIPARAGSKGVPNKNVRMLGGHSVLSWSIAACLKTTTIERTLVSTDSAEYAELAKRSGAEAPFLRPAAISADGSTDYDFIVHALDWLVEHGEEPDFVVHIRPTTPFRDPMVLDTAVRKFTNARNFTALRSVHPMPESAYKAFEIGLGGQLKRVGSDSTMLDAANNARQAFPVTYQPNGYVDVLSTEFIRKSGLIHGDNVMPFITTPVVEIDNEEDFSYLEYQLLKDPSTTRQLFE